MILKNKITGEQGEHWVLFPNISFPNNRPTPEWIQDNSYEEVVIVFVAPELTPEELETQTIVSLTQTVQHHLDAKSKEKNYDDIVSACSYAACPNVFQEESQKFLIWRANCWATCYSVMTEVKQGQRNIPTSDELISLLPELVL